MSVLRAVIKLGHAGGGSTITQQLAKYMLGRVLPVARRVIEKLKNGLHPCVWRETLLKKKYWLYI
jgi:membrane carboxypeptidase/penicillin-binding protein